MIEKYSDIVAKIIMYSQEYPFDIDPTEMIKDWYTAKKLWIDLFNGKTYIRSKEPVKVTLSPKQRNDKFNEFLSILDDGNVLTQEFRDFLYFNKQGFFANTVTTSYLPLNIPCGAKLSKSFKKFVNREDVRWTQDLASRFMQEDKIEGYLYLSVDPVDFLTLSENSFNWTSCHSLDGDFRAGDLSYMCDKTTVIAFIADEKRSHWRCLPHDIEAFSKKWRMLVHTDIDRDFPCIYYNREYPFSSEELVSSVHNLLIETMKISLDDYTEPANIGSKIIQNDTLYNYMSCSGRIFLTSDIIDTSDYLGYCDLTTSSIYIPIASARVDLLQKYHELMASKKISLIEEFNAFRDIFKIKIGAKVKCVVCGDHYIERNDLFLCDKCIAENDADEDFFLKCNECSRKLYEDEESIYWTDEDEPCCKKCYNEILREENIVEEDT